MEWAKIPLKAKIALGCAILAFFVSLESMSRRTRNGVVTECAYVDYAAVILGGLAVVLGLIALVSSLKLSSWEGAIASALAIVLALYHLAAGTGMIGSPCG